MEQEVVLGIDLGTTNSAVAIVEGGEPEIIENAEGDRLTPSVVRYPKPEDDRERPYVGVAAKNEAVTNADRTVTSAKRKMGENFSYQIGDQRLTPEHISAEILQKIKRDSAQRLGVEPEDLTEAVITVPAYFREDAREATRQAAKMAGFSTISLLNEPTAAAIEYGFSKDGEPKTIAVFDLGGGTYDISVVEVGHGAFRTQATSGIRDLGGDDWDERIVQHIVQGFVEEYDYNPLEELPSDTSPADSITRKERLYDEAREVKHQLTNQQGGAVDAFIPYFAEINGERINLEETIRQSEFKRMTESLRSKVVDPTLDAVNEAGLAIHEIDEVILVGGATRMEQITEAVTDIFGMEPEMTVNPDEAVARGAAVKGNATDVLIRDVTPLSLGIKLHGGVYEPIIDRNTPLPVTESETFTTSSDNATNVAISLHQGEHEIADKNKFLKEFYLTNLPPAGRHVPTIEVEITVKESGIIEARARDTNSGDDIEQEVTIEETNVTNLSKREVEKYIEEARAERRVDEKRVRVREAKNDAREVINECQRLINDYHHVLEDDIVQELQDLANETKELVASNQTRVSTLEAHNEDARGTLAEAGNKVYGADESASKPSPSDMSATTESSDSDVGIGQNQVAEASAPSVSEPEENADGESGSKGETEDIIVDFPDAEAPDPSAPADAESTEAEAEAESPPAEDEAAQPTADAGADSHPMEAEEDGSEPLTEQASTGPEARQEDVEAAVAESEQQFVGSETDVTEPLSLQDDPERTDESVTLAEGEGPSDMGEDHAEADPVETGESDTGGEGDAEPSEDTGVAWTASSGEGEDSGGGSEDGEYPDEQVVTEGATGEDGSDTQEEPSGETGDGDTGGGSGGFGGDATAKTNHDEGYDPSLGEDADPAPDIEEKDVSDEYNGSEPEVEPDTDTSFMGAGESESGADHSSNPEGGGAEAETDGRGPDVEPSELGRSDTDMPSHEITGASSSEDRGGKMDTEDGREEPTQTPTDAGSDSRDESTGAGESTEPAKTAGSEADGPESEAGDGSEGEDSEQDVGNSFTFLSEDGE